MNASLRELAVLELVLDLGGGESGTSSYHDLIPNLRSSGTISLNIEDSRRPTVQGDAQGLLPFRDNSFATCLALNLLEHVLLVEQVLHDVHRVLKEDGTFVIAVPFLCRVHADPSDYFRYTQYAIESLLRQCGFVVEQMRACGTGAMTAALSQLDFAVPKLLRRPVFSAACTLDRLITRRSGGRHRNAHDYPLGYLVVCRAGGPGG